MVEAARKYQRIVQHGTQCRTSPKIREGIEKLQGGRDRPRVHGPRHRLQGPRRRPEESRARARRNALGPLARPRARGRAYNELCIDRWRFLKNYGNGEIGDQGVHQLDIIRWGLGLKRIPRKVQSMGGRLRPSDDDEDTPAQPDCRRSNMKAPDCWSSSRPATGTPTAEAGMGDRVSVRRPSQRGGRDLLRHATAT